VGEWRFLAGQVRAVEHIQRAVCVDVEVIKRARGREDVARLSASVDNGKGSDFLEQRQHGGALADIEFMMQEILLRGGQAHLVPSGIAGGTEEIGAHVVVHAVYLPVIAAERSNDFRTNESGGAGAENCLHAKD